MRESYIRKANEMRSIWSAGDSLRDAGLEEPAGIRRYVNIIYAEREFLEMPDHQMDIYVPENAGEPLPCIVSVHGGGWFYGDKDLYRMYCLTLAAKGAAVVNFNYRRSPEHVYPAAIEDVCLAMSYVKNHGKEYDIDVERVAMVGDSVGAQLASQYGVIATNEKYRKLFPFEADVLLPKALAFNCGIFHMPDFTKDDMRLWYFPEETEGPLRESFMNMLSYMGKNYPPVYLMLSVNDDLAVHTEAMKQRLEELQTEFVYREFGADNEEDSHVFHLNMRSENGKRCNEEEFAFLMKYV